MTSDRVRTVSRRLRDLCEPIAASVYFLPEAHEAYRTLGLEGFAEGYFSSRSACLGRPPPSVVASAFGVFNPALVVPAVEAAWSKTEPEAVLQARESGATAGLRRILGEADTQRATDILLDAMESVPYTGRTLFAGLRSLPLPDDPIARLWRACDYVRERRGDGHIACWVAAGCDAVEISLLTELYWGLQLGTYIKTRGWSDDDIARGIAQLEEKGYVRDGAFTEAGRTFRREIERATDALEADVVEALGGRVDELFSLLEPWQRAVLEARAYPVDPARTMSADTA